MGLKGINKYLDAELLDATKAGNVEKVKSLLAEGTDVNAKSKDGDTVLMYALQKGHTEIVKALLDNGADANAKDKDGDTVLMYALQKGHTEIVKALLDKGADVNAKNKDDATALIEASRDGPSEIVKALLEKGADIGAVDKENITSLQWAIKMCNLETAKLLLRGEHLKYSHSEYIKRLLIPPLEFSKVRLLESSKKMKNQGSMNAIEVLMFMEAIFFFVSNYAKKPIELVSKEVEILSPGLLKDYSKPSFSRPANFCPEDIGLALKQLDLGIDSITRLIQELERHALIESR